MEARRSEKSHVREINSALVPLSEPPHDHELDTTESARERLICDNNPHPPPTGLPHSAGNESPIADTARQPHVYLIDRIPGQQRRHPSENQESWIVHADRIFRGWWLELFCCWLSIASLAALILFLLGINHKPPPTWPSGITVNTVVASLSTVARTAFTVPVAEGLSQCKWNWFKKRPRPIEDFSLFDEASRGPWGSMCLLTRTKGW
ncbi:Carboxylic ester hydrolase [Colletotrichum asianum]